MPTDIGNIPPSTGGGGGGGGAATLPSTLVLDDAATNTSGDVLVLRHITSGTAAAGFGATFGVDLESAGGVVRRAMNDTISWVTATNGGEVATRTIQMMQGGALQDALYISFNQLTVIGGSAHIGYGQYGDVSVGRQNGTGACEILGSAGGIAFLNRVSERKGADIASASTITVGIDGNYVHVTGSTAIDFLTNTGIQDGTAMVLYFVAAVTVNNNTGAPPGGTYPFALSGSVNYVATAGSRLTVRRDTALGKWVETGRTPG